MLLIINLLLLILGSAGALAAFGGETWKRNNKNFLNRITLRGWISLVCLLCALFLGVTKEIMTNKATALAAIKSQSDQAALQHTLDEANVELAQAKIRVKELEDRLLAAVDEATSRIPQEIDHPFFDTSYRSDGVVNSSVTGQPLKLLAGEVLTYNIHGIGARYLNMVSFQIGHREYRLNAQSGSITVIGYPREPMPVRINYRGGLKFAMKMTVKSTIRRSMR